MGTYFLTASLVEFDNLHYLNKYKLDLINAEFLDEMHLICFVSLGKRIIYMEHGFVNEQHIETFYEITIKREVAWHPCI